jgi:hypothetical protein
MHPEPVDAARRTRPNANWQNGLFQWCRLDHFYYTIAALTG